MNTCAKQPKFYIVSDDPPCFELLSFFLEKEFKAECVLWDDSPRSIFNDEDIDRPVIFLVDCFEHAMSEIEKRLQNFMTHYQENNQIVIFNVAPELRLERLVKHCRIRGIFYLNDSQETFLCGIRKILKGQLWLTRKMLADCILMSNESSIQFDPSLQDLSDREKEILKFIGSGASNQDIAENLLISVHTVKTHLYHIYRKINVSNRTQASVLATAYVDRYAE